jgi:hypothetical protein
MSTGKVCLLSVAVLTAAGCATPYKSHGLGGGYSEKKISDSAYVVSFNGNGFATKDRVYYFWMYRCAELTLKSGYSLFYIRANEKTASVPTNRAGFATPALYRPSGTRTLDQVYSDETPAGHAGARVAVEQRDADQGELIKVKGGGGAPRYTYIPGGTSTSTSWSYSGTVLMFAQPLPEEEIWAFDAHTIVDDLKPYVTSNGGGAPPARGDMIKHAFTAHARVDFGDDMRVTASAPPASLFPGSPPAVAEPRSAGEIQEKIDFSSVYFYDAFHSHMRHALEKTGGRIVLGFTITPNGTVKECHVASTTFTDTVLVSTVLSVCRHFQFGPRNVLETNVTYYPLVFTPKS